MRAKAVLKLSLFGSPVAWIIEKINGWYFENYGYVLFVMVAIFFDHVLGTWVHGWIKRDFSFKKNVYGLFTKISLSVFVGIMIEGMTHIMGKENFITDYFSLVCRLMVFVYPAGSALWNCAIITKGVFPPVSFLKKVKGFNESLDLKQFDKNTENEKT